MTNLEILEREIRAMRNTVVNGLSTRLHHPTYGVTKVGLNRDVNVLSGLVIAHRIMAGKAPANPTSLINDYSRETFDIDIAALFDLIRAS